MEEVFNRITRYFGKEPYAVLTNLAGTLAMVVIGFFIIRYICRLMDTALQRTRIDRSIVSFLNSFVSIGLKTLLIVMAAIQLGVPSATFVAILGSCGLAIGLALQGGLTNLAGGLMILIFHPFRVGHVISAGTDAGTVKEIGILYTVLETVDRRTVVVPNGALAGGVVVNYSASPFRRIDIDLSLLPDAPVEKVCALMAAVAESHPKVVAQEGIEARLYSVTGGVMVYGLRAFARQADWWQTKLDLTEQTVRALQKQGIRFATPMLTVETLSRE